MRLGIIGCGYVGRAMATSWSVDGHQVTVTTRNKERLCDLKDVLVCQIDIRQQGCFHDFLKNLDILLISVAPDPEGSYHETYLGTVEKVIYSLPNGSNLRQIIYLSSTSVYGDHQGAVVNEETPVSPLNENAKILCDAEEKLISLSSSQLKICIFRLGEIIGPGRRVDDRLRKSVGRLFPGDGSQVTNIIHLDDILRVINFALKNSLSGIYNACCDYHASRKTLYDEICKREGLPPVEWSMTISPHGGNKNVSNDKLKKLGFIFNSF